MIDNTQLNKKLLKNKVSKQQIKHISDLLSNSGMGQLSSFNNNQNKAFLLGDQPDELVHFLNRISYGYAAEELDFVRDIGQDAYLEYQLTPENIDTSAIDELLNLALPSTQMSYQ